MLIYGINPVLEALRAGRVTAIRVSPRADDRVSDALARAEQQGVPVRRVQAVDLDRETRGAAHQGVVADVETERSVGLRELAEGASPLIIVLDGIEDPHNLGAILRTADAAGVDGVIRQARRERAEAIHCFIVEPIKSLFTRGHRHATRTHLAAAR